MNDDDLADALDHEARTRRPMSRRAKLTVLISVIVLVAVSVGALLWQQHRKAADRPSTAEVEKAILGADLLTDDWPVKAVAAFKRDTKLTQVSRILLTPTQVQATGPTTDVAASQPATTKWSDYVYVEDRASSLGDALVAPKASDLFNTADINAAAIAPLVAQAPSLTKIPQPISLQVVVARDPATENMPVRIQVFVTGSTTTGLVTADASGKILRTE